MADANTIISLSEDDVRVLQAVVADFRGRSANTRGRTYTPPSLPTAPEVYIVLTPPGGIPGSIGITPGQASCTIYRISGVTTSAPTIESVAFEETVYNISPQSTDSEAFLVAQRDKWGTFVISSTPFATNCGLPTYMGVTNACLSGGILTVEYTVTDLCVGAPILQWCVTNPTGCCAAPSPSTGTGTGTGTLRVGCCSNENLCAHITNPNVDTGNFNDLNLVLTRSIVGGNITWTSAWTSADIVVEPPDPGYNDDMEVRVIVTCIPDGQGGFGYFTTAEFKYSIGTNPPVIASISFYDALIYFDTHCATLDVRSHRGAFFPGGGHTFYLTAADLASLAVQVSADLSNCAGGPTGTGAGECCPDPQPSQVCVTITLESGVECEWVGSYILTLSGEVWLGSLVVSSELTLHLELACIGGQYILYLSDGTDEDFVDLNLNNCTPTFVLFGTDIPLPATCPGDTVHILVTSDMSDCSGTTTPPGPVNTTCCPVDLVPGTLSLNIAGAFGCECMAGTYVLTYNFFSGAWEGNASLCFGNAVTMSLTCNALADNLWRIDIKCNGVSMFAKAADIVVCNPLSLTFGQAPVNVNACCSGNISGVVTP